MNLCVILFTLSLTKQNVDLQLFHPPNLQSIIKIIDVYNLNYNFKILIYKSTYVMVYYLQSTTFTEKEEWKKKNHLQLTCFESLLGLQFTMYIKAKSTTLP